MRTFIGLWPDGEAIDRLGALDRPSIEGLRWTTPEQWHVTLRFCGDVADGDLPRLAAALGEALAGEPAVVVTAGPGTARLGDRILQVPVRGADRLASIVRSASEPFGSAVPDHPFTGHVTLARARRRVPAALVGLAVEASWPVSEVAVVASRLGPGGARYETVAAVPLAL